MNVRNREKTKHRRMENRNGFTLVELLVSLMLSVILIGAILMTFQAAMEVFDKGTARMDIYSNIRSAMDVMERDLSGIVPTENGGQRFVLAQNADSQFPGRTTDQFGGGTGSGGSFGRVNGWVMEPGTPEKPTGGAADLIGFIANTEVGGNEQKRGVVYRVVPIRDASLLETDLGRFRTVKSNRIVTALKRVTISPTAEITGRDSPQKNGQSSSGSQEGGNESEETSQGNAQLYYGPDGLGGEMWNTDNTVLRTNDQSSNEQRTREVTVGYLSQYILSFNVEVLPDNLLDNGFIDLNADSDKEQRKLTDLERKYLNPNEHFQSSNHYPIGNGSRGEPDLPDAIRVTMRFTDSRKEVQERVAQRVFWIPVE